MSTHTQTITVEWVQAGQPRAYADSIYEAIIGFATDAEWAKRGWLPPESVVWEIAQAVMNRGRFLRKDDPERKWHQTYADRFEKRADGRWHVRLVQPYCD